jgi:subfamily B ATP-binding cassette protein MsbA
VDVVKVFTAEERETRKIHHNLTNFMQSSITSNIIRSISSEVLALLGALGRFIVLWYGGSEIIRGNFTIGSYIAFAAYLGKLYGPIQILASMGLTLQPAATALSRVSELFDLTTEDEDKKRTVKLLRINGKIEFKNVYFSYNHKKEDVLQDINFKIEPGEKVAFVGPSGSGKSTILKLILGLYPIERGKILIDNQDINKLLLSNLREKISIVSQNTFLFNDTVKNNILYSKPNAKEEEIIKTTKYADAYDFIMNLENGFETIVGEMGKKLSGGEKQRISIARAILKDSDIIIFDEATSHLDNESERRIQRMINENFANKTCIIVAHRLSTIINVDKIYILDNGRIVQRGSHTELITKEGRYKQIYSGI